jgi:hypothetical protein
MMGVSRLDGPLVEDFSAALRRQLRDRTPAFSMVGKFVASSD